MERRFSDWIHPDGWRFIALFAGASVLLSFLSHTLGVIGCLLTLWCVSFFRNPGRVVPTRPGLIVSPGDGKIVLIESVIPPEPLNMGDEPRFRISVFLNIFDVHTNRIPTDGVVEHIVYHPGQFFNASTDKASDLNERNTVVIETPFNQKVAVVQIAGLIARRIRCDVKVGERVGIGHLYGLIRFGSRVDVYLPVGVNPLVIEGQRAIGGETIFADLTALEDRRIGYLA